MTPTVDNGRLQRGLYEALYAHASIQRGRERLCEQAHSLPLYARESHRFRACDEREGPMTVIHRQALTRLDTALRCPSCRRSNILWYGALRVCAACANVFHWRDAVHEA